MPRGEANGHVWIAVDAGLLLGIGKLDDCELDRAQQGWLYLAIIAFCRQRLTDGFVKDAEAIRVVQAAMPAASTDRKLTPERRLADLVGCGLLKRERWGWRVPDYAEWQQTKADVRALSERQTAKARKRWKREPAGMPPASHGHPGGNAEKEKESPYIPRGKSGRAGELETLTPRETGMNPRAAGTNPRARTRKSKSLASAERYVATQREHFPELTDAELTEDVQRSFTVLTAEQIGAIIHHHENGDA